MTQSRTGCFATCAVAALISSAPQPRAAGPDSAPITVTVHADQPGPGINPDMWGIFFEDINFGADGGLYAELVKNRAFEFPEAMMGWSKLSPSKARGSLAIREEDPVHAANPHYVRLKA